MNIRLILRSIRNIISRNMNYVKFLVNGIKINRSFRLLGRIQIYNYGNITIGEKFTLVSISSFNPLCKDQISVLRSERNAILEIGKSVGISSSIIWAFKSIIIGNNVNIGADCIIMDSDCHSLNPVDRLCGKDEETRLSKPIIIGNNVFIGARVIILKGVNIGDNSIIGAGSVVTRSIPSNCIAAGNPCRVIKYIN